MFLNSFLDLQKAPPTYHGSPLIAQSQVAPRRQHRRRRRDCLRDEQQRVGGARVGGAEGDG